MKVLMILSLTMLMTSSVFACNGNKDKEDSKDQKVTSTTIQGPVYIGRM